VRHARGALTRSSAGVIDNEPELSGLYVMRCRSRPCSIRSTPRMTRGQLVAPEPARRSLCTFVLSIGLSMNPEIAG
jgi:hypothetical protein